MVAAHHGERDHLLREGQAALVMGRDGHRGPSVPSPPGLDGAFPWLKATPAAALGPPTGSEGPRERVVAGALTRNFSFTSRSSASSSNSFWGYTSMPLDSRSAVICRWGEACGCRPRGELDWPLASPLAVTFTPSAARGSGSRGGGARGLVTSMLSSYCASRAERQWQTCPPGDEPLPKGLGALSRASPRLSSLAHHTPRKQTRGCRALPS